MNETLAGEKFQLEHQELFNSEGGGVSPTAEVTFAAAAWLPVEKTATLHDHSATSQDFIKARELRVRACAMHVWRPWVSPPAYSTTPKRWHTE